MLHAPGKVEFKAGKKELRGPVSVSNAEIAKKIHELNVKRDLTIEYVDADGNALTNELINMKFQGKQSETVSLDGNGKAVLRNAPLGPYRAVQPDRR